MNPKTLKAIISVLPSLLSFIGSIKPKENNQTKALRKKIDDKLKERYS